MPQEPIDIACCAVFDNKNRLLLLRRHRRSFGSGLWAVPGGLPELNETPAVTAARETREETGLDLNEIEYLGAHEMRMPHGVVHMKTFIARVDGAEKIIIDPEEHEDYRWFTLDELFTNKDIIWGLPTTLLDFGLIENFDEDPTLSDGSQAILLERK